MKGLRKKILYIFVMLFAGLFLQSTSAWTALWQFDATRKINFSWMSDFSVVFNDTDNDNVIELSPIIPPASMSPEIVSFSGVSWFGFDLDRLIGIPSWTVDGLTLVGTVDTWQFQRSSDGVPGEIIGGQLTGWYNYSAQVHVPIPGALWLLGSGLIGIVGIRRKFKK
jgi:hypothetical protein